MSRRVIPAIGGKPRVVNIRQAPGRRLRASSRRSGIDAVARGRSWDLCLARTAGVPARVEVHSDRGSGRGSVETGKKSGNELRRRSVRTEVDRSKACSEREKTGTGSPGDRLPPGLQDLRARMETTDGDWTARESMRRVEIPRRDVEGESCQPLWVGLGRAFCPAALLTDEVLSLFWSAFPSNQTIKF
jgi:hypothetical protein